MCRCGVIPRIQTKFLPLLGCRHRLTIFIETRIAVQAHTGFKVPFLTYKPILVRSAHCTLLAINRMDCILARKVLRSPDAKVPGETLTRGQEIDYLPYRTGMTGKENPVSGDALFVGNDNAFPR